MSPRTNRETCYRICYETGGRYPPRPWSAKRSGSYCNRPSPTLLIYREVFQLRDIDQLSINEAAAALGISIAAVKDRLHRARMMLQKKLAPELKQVAPKRRWWAWS